MIADTKGNPQVVLLVFGRGRQLARAFVAKHTVAVGGPVFVKRLGALFTVFQIRVRSIALGHPGTGTRADEAA